MSYIRFFELFPDVAMKETRTIIALKHNVYDVPPGEYSLIEMYCDDEGCDCQRVFLNVVSSITKKSMAVITFGWESREFYTKWFTRGKSVDQIEFLRPGNCELYAWGSFKHYQLSKRYCF